ncbi:NAD(P)-binding domain-containing protein [Devosia rhizoryzae]|uniref:NAD(P)-binding domain-containing protein n=1 Tax=Devosia rhizoryzae TaxID=2774137 RepID=UPI001E371EBA|nr:NAD(P)-binding domain-containing protein [Devosia rhizoryzae]
MTVLVTESSVSYSSWDGEQPRRTGHRWRAGRLATSYRLAKAGVSHLVVDASERIGNSWRRRYHCLTLFTPRRLSALPGLDPGGDPEGYAGRLEFADYLDRYATVNRLPIRSGSRVVRLGKSESVESAAHMDDGTVINSRAVLVSTGAFQQAAVPSISSGFTQGVKQLTAASYRSPLSVGKGPVLVVGDGASGRDIAMELGQLMKC